MPNRIFGVTPTFHREPVRTGPIAAGQPSEWVLADTCVALVVIIALSIAVAANVVQIVNWLVMR